MDQTAKFIKWVEERGVKINGVTVREFPGRGFGIIAERDLQAEEVILFVPRSALLVADIVNKEFPKSFKEDITVHGLLAAELCLHLDASEHLALWRSVLPTPASFKASVPLAWPETLQALLPPGAAALLAKQQKKFEIDWTRASTEYPALSRSDYLHNWLVVNTRCFYYQPNAANKSNGKSKSMSLHGAALKKRKLARDDYMALAPFADIFNHASPPPICDVRFSIHGFTIVTQRPCKAGDELCITYGGHSNDFLFAEYGFILPDDTNPFDQIPIDALMLPELTKKQQTLLDDAGFLGNYTLDAQGACFRTEVALRLTLAKTEGEWQRFVSGMSSSDAGEERMKTRVHAVLRRLLEDYAQEVDGKIAEVNEIGDEYADQRDLLARRWEQVRELVKRGLEKAA